MKVLAFLVGNWQVYCTILSKAMFRIEQYTCQPQQGKSRCIFIAYFLYAIRAFDHVFKSCRRPSVSKIEHKSIFFTGLTHGKDFTGPTSHQQFFVSPLGWAHTYLFTPLIENLVNKMKTDPPRREKDFRVRRRCERWKVWFDLGLPQQE